MEFTKVEHLREDLWVINELDKTFMYLINGAERALLLDTGLGISDLPEIVESICGKKPYFVVNTHAHGDHNSGNFLYDSVYVGRFDELYSHNIMSLEEREKSRESYFTEAIENGFDFAAWAPGPARQIRTIKNGDVFNLGNYCLEVIEIPGHTAGSVALLERKNGWIFTGDTVLTWQTWGHLTNGVLAPSVSLKNYWESVRLLERYEKQISVVFPSHGQKENNPEGYTQYTLKPEIFRIYDEGIVAILTGKAGAEPFVSCWENGKVSLFPIGGVVYNPNRLY